MSSCFCARGNDQAAPRHELAHWRGEPPSYAGVPGAGSGVQCSAMPSGDTPMPNRRSRGPQAEYHTRHTELGTTRRPPPQATQLYYGATLRQCRVLELQFYAAHSHFHVPMPAVVRRLRPVSWYQLATTTDYTQLHFLSQKASPTVQALVEGSDPAADVLLFPLVETLGWARQKARAAPGPYSRGPDSNWAAFKDELALNGGMGCGNTFGSSLAVAKLLHALFFENGSGLPAGCVDMFFRFGNADYNKKRFWRRCCDWSALQLPARQVECGPFPVRQRHPSI